MLSLSSASVCASGHLNPPSTHKDKYLHQKENLLFSISNFYIVKFANDSASVLSLLGICHCAVSEMQGELFIVGFISVL